MSIDLTIATNGGVWHFAGRSAGMDALERAALDAFLALAGGHEEIAEPVVRPELPKPRERAQRRKPEVVEDRGEWFRKSS